jgi:hypothetical protein
MRVAVALMAWVAAVPMYAQANAADDRGAILKAREAVWRAWFADDVSTLKRLVPEDTIVISSGEAAFLHQAEVLKSAAEFHASGGRLVSLEFPHTEMQRFGDVAVTWSTYRLETDVKGKREVDTGRASEIFVLRGGRWLNPGWHTDPGKGSAGN